MSLPISKINKDKNNPIIKMNKTLVLFAVFAFAALLVFGCASQNQYPTGAASYGQPNQPQGGYIGGGCGVAPAEDYDSLSVDVSGTALAA